MDIITLSLAVKKTLKELGVDVKRAKTITFDGNITGKETIPGEVMGLSGVYVKVSDTAFAVDELQSVSATTITDGEKENSEIPLSAITVQEDGSVTFLVQNEMPIAIVVAESFSSDELSMTVGTYFLCDENYLNLGTYYVSSIIYGKETIVPIDPKYLPGVCLPVVELTLEQVSNIVQAGAAGWTVESGYLFDALEAAYNAGLPIIVRLPGQSGILPVIAAATESDDVFAYEFKFSDTTILMSRLTIEELSAWKIAVSGV